MGFGITPHPLKTLGEGEAGAVGASDGGASRRDGGLGGADITTVTAGAFDAAWLGDRPGGFINGALQLASVRASARPLRTGRMAAYGTTVAVGFSDSGS